MSAKLKKAQIMALEWGCRGFCRTSRRTGEQMDAGLTMHTVAGLVRRGWIQPNRNEIFYTTEAGRAALQKATRETNHER